MSDPLFAVCTAPEDERCDFDVQVWTPTRKQELEEAHAQRQHGIEPPAREALPQAPYVEFQAAFGEAVRALPVGWIGTTADLHGLVAEPADHHWWGLAQKHVAHMGWLRERSRVESTLETTKRSLVRQWERVEPARRTA